MFCQRLLPLLTLLALALFHQPLTAADYRYHVEVIVFEHLNMDSSESWPPEDERPRWENALRIFAGDSDSRFNPLSAGSYRMSGVYRTLRSAQAYRPLLHTAWIQDGLPASRARAVYLESDGGQVEGQLKLEQSRFLYVDMDLIYPFGDREGRYAHIKERRRLKLKELHYFDNPVFGAIVRITRAGE